MALFLTYFNLDTPKSSIPQNILEAWLCLVWEDSATLMKKKYTFKFSADLHVNKALYWFCHLFVVNIDDDVNARIAKASAEFGRLSGSIWDQIGIRLDTKLKVYRSVVLPTLLYACETWTVYQRHAKRLNHFYASCLRKLLKIKWQDRIPDTESWKGQGYRVYMAQLRWTGHVTRMPNERLPKKFLYGELQAGKRSHSGQKKRHKYILKASLKDFNIPTESWE